jgi:hypothetical protein
MGNRICAESGPTDYLPIASDILGGDTIICEKHIDGKGR